MRILPFPVSHMYTFPNASVNTDDGLFNFAAVAGPPSPLDPVLLGTPANVEYTPFLYRLTQCLFGV